MHNWASYKSKCLSVRFSWNHYDELNDTYAFILQSLTVLDSLDSFENYLQHTNRTSILDKGYLLKKPDNILHMEGSKAS